MSFHLSKNKGLASVAATALLLLAGSTAMAQGSTSGNAPAAAGATTSGTNSGMAKSDLARGDRKFVEEAAAGGMAEVELGKLAQQKATNEQVKQFGARMVQDHTKANDELKALASSKGVQLPAGPTKSQQRDMDKMNKLSGAEFDRDYTKHMLADHKKDVSLFEKQSKSGKDADLKAFAGKTLPTLQEHLQMVQALNDTVKNAK